MKVLLTRPRADSIRLAAQIRPYGFSPLIAPMTRIVWRSGLVPALSQAQGLVFTSANGVRAFARVIKTKGLERLRGRGSHGGCSARERIFRRGERRGRGKKN